MLVSVVVPCYNSEHTIRELVELTIEEFRKLPEYEVEFILVNDHSKDGTWKVLEELSREYPFVRTINFIRNFGQHNALMAALNHASGDLVVGMDDDMQTHPSQLHILLEKMKEGYDVVYGEYPHCKNSFLKNLSSRFNAYTASVLLGRPRSVVSSNYWVITRLVRDEVIKYTNFNPYVDAIFFRVTDNIGDAPIEHFKREYGSSNYSFKKLVRLWLAYFNFTVIPLHISAYLGVIFSIAGFIGAIAVLIRQLVSPSGTLGWASLMCAMLLFFGIVLLVLGIMGEYVGKIILSINKTPQYIIRETHNLGEKENQRQKAENNENDHGSGSRAVPGSPDPENKGDGLPGGDGQLPG